VTDAEAALAQVACAEAALLTANGGAALLVAVAATVPCGERLVVQRGHVVDLGGSPVDIARLAAVVPVEIGFADACSAMALGAALGTAKAGLLVGGIAGDELLDLPRFGWACHRAGVPVIVHLNRGRDWTARLDAGADLVVVDLARSLGIDGGLLLGRADLVATARRRRDGVASLLAPRSALEAEVRLED
jgi:seryl-tRNA(Sec) selenium transferase